MRLKTNFLMPVLCFFLTSCTGKNATVSSTTNASVSVNTIELKTVSQEASVGLDGVTAPTEEADEGTYEDALGLVEITAPTEEVDDRGYIVKTGDTAPDFTLKTTDNKEIKLSDLRGKIVMLQFTASWCGVCRKEMPFIERDIWQKHRNNSSFALYGIDRDEPLKTVLDFIKKTGVSYPMLLDPGADVFALYADRKAGITRNILIDRNGKIALLTRLYDEKEFSALCKKIDELLLENE